MSDDPFIRKLKSFTPDRGELDRDALMFAAGRASVRRRWGWIVAVVLVVQTGMLATLFWLRPGPGVPVAVAPQTVPAPGKTNVSRPPPDTKPPEAIVGKEDPRPPPADEKPGMSPIDDIFGRKFDSARPPMILYNSAKERSNSFVVSVLDGRQMTVKPIEEKLSRYNVSATDLERRVRKRLTELFVQYPNEVHVLHGMDNPGKGVPVQWVADPDAPGGRKATTAGEPLNQLADVTFSGEKGPQAADLERMVSMHWTTWGAISADKKMPRSEFERLFGVVAESKNRVWIYSIARSRVFVRFDGEPQRLTAIEYVEGTPSASAEGLPPEERGKYYRAVYQIDRDFLFAFWLKRFRDAGPDEMNRLRRFLDSTARVAEWTEQERNELLSPDS